MGSVPDWLILVLFFVVMLVSCTAGGWLGIKYVINKVIGFIARYSKNG